MCRKYAIYPALTEVHDKDFNMYNNLEMGEDRGPSEPGRIGGKSF